jgi:hypothetical protein
VILVTTNIAEIVKTDLGILHDLAQTDRLLRLCANTSLDAMKVRIHRDGLDASERKIGTYSPGYMKVRTGGFLNASRNKKGNDKGGLKDAGVFTKGKNKGATRPKYNRGSDTKVILSLTRQMENDMKVSPIDKGYGIGYSNSHNFDKSQWVEETYYGKGVHGKIFTLSPKEIEVVNAIIKQFTDDALTGKAS